MTRQQAEATRRHLLDTAASLFAEKGYEATSFRDLIEASGLSKGAFFFHFPSKQQLALEVFRHKQAELGEAVAEVVPKEGPALERFSRLWMERARVSQADPAMRCLGKIAGALARDPSSRAEVLSFHQVPIRLMGELLRQAQSQGDLRGDVDPEQVAALAVAAVFGLEELSDRETERADLVERSDAFLDVFLDGLRPS